LPREHDLGGSIVPSGDVTCHLWVLYAGQAEIANLEIAILIHENVAGF
jgi:hypothetical protein